MQNIYFILFLIIALQVEYLFFVCLQNQYFFFIIIYLNRVPEDI